MVDVVDSVLKDSGIDEKFLGITLFALVPNTTEFMNAISFALNENIALRFVYSDSTLSFAEGSRQSQHGNWFRVCTPGVSSASPYHGRLFCLVCSREDGRDCLLVHVSSFPFLRVIDHSYCC